MFEAAVRGVPSVVNAGVLMGAVATGERFGVACPWNDPQALVDALLHAKAMHVPQDAGTMQEASKASWLEALERLMA
jgi:hypothetical protein